MKPHVVLHSPLAPAEAEAAIRAAISDPPPAGMDGLARRGSKGVVGTVRGGKIRIRMLQTGLNSFAPVFRGVLLPRGAGSRIEGRFGLATEVRFFLGCISVAGLGIAIPLFVGDAAESGGGMDAGLVFLGILAGFALWIRVIWFLAAQDAADQEGMMLRCMVNALQGSLVPVTPLPPPR